MFPEALLNNFGKHQNFIIELCEKKFGKESTKKYSPEVCQFALLLQNKCINKLFIQSKVFSQFMNSKIFKSLSSHSADSNSALLDHLTLLIKLISSTYMSLKIRYSLKSHNETPSLACGIIS